MLFKNRIPAGNIVFARVFNASTVSQATFYSDTYPIKVPQYKASSLVVKFKNAMPLDSGDDDHDGLNNSWEAFLGINDIHQIMTEMDPAI